MSTKGQENKSNPPPSQRQPVPENQQRGNEQDISTYGGLASGNLSHSEDALRDTTTLLNSTVQQALSTSNTMNRPTVMMMTPMQEDDNDDSEDDTPRGEKRAGRRKIRIEYIEDKSRRHITFSKRKAGIMKKAYELSTLTGTQVLLLVASETGHVYTFATPKLQPLITKPEGKNLIQACLNAPDTSAMEYPPPGNYDAPEEKETGYEERASSSAVPQNYASAMAGLAGFQYPPNQGGNSSATAQYLNAAHYPAYAAQYNAALAAGYWPGTGAPASAMSSSNTPSGNPSNPINMGGQSAAGQTSGSPYSSTPISQVKNTDPSKSTRQ